MSTPDIRLALKDGVSVSTGMGSNNVKPIIEFVDNNCNSRSSCMEVLLSGQGIKYGGRIYSSSREFYVTLEEDGNIVLFKELNNARQLEGGIDADRVVVWSSGIPEPPEEYLTNNNTMFDNYHGPYSLVMQHDGNLVLCYSREHCLLPVSVDSEEGITSSNVCMVKTDKGFTYWKDETDEILLPTIEEYYLSISNTWNNPGAKLVVTDWGHISIIEGGSAGLPHKVLWRRG
jgi:hypothetical protein